MYLNLYLCITFYLSIYLNFHRFTICYLPIYFNLPQSMSFYRKLPLNSFLSRFTSPGLGPRALGCVPGPTLQMSIWHTPGAQAPGPGPTQATGLGPGPGPGRMLGRSGLGPQAQGPGVYPARPRHQGAGARLWASHPRLQAAGARAPGP